MKKYIIYICCLFATAILLTACSQEEEFAVSGDAIMFDLSSTVMDKNTRGILFDKESSLYLEELGGGNFTVQAFVDQTAKKYIDSRVWYFKDGGRWWFRSGNEWFDCYWPKNNKLSFFAFLPWQPENATVTIDDEYTFGNGNDGGPVFSCNLPLSNTAAGINQESVYEFAYAYTKDRQNETVELRFVHPMTAVLFALKQSHRDLTIHNLGFKNIYNKGKFSYGQETTNVNKDQFYGGFTYKRWKPVGTPDNSLIISVEKTIPKDINFDAEVGGPFIVMPQDLENVIFFISYTWDTEKNVTKTVKLKDVYGVNNAWQPGYRYTYVLDLGDNKEEILFRVLVEPWDPVEYKNEMDID